MGAIAARYIHKVQTPLGTALCCFSDRGLCLFEFADRIHIEQSFEGLSKGLKRPLLEDPQPHLELLQQELDSYFGGQLIQFSAPLHIVGTEFQKQVWSSLMQIPYGETRTYSDQAEIMNRPDALRAIASANGKNRIAVLIPCHRVIGKNGALTGYSGGLARKRDLLRLESRNST